MKQCFPPSAGATVLQINPEHFGSIKITPWTLQRRQKSYLVTNSLFSVPSSFPSPFANAQAARAANGGALPPDLSLISKARDYGPDYIRGLMVGYKDAPADVEMAPGMNYNEYYAGNQIAMAAPLVDDLVEYGDDTEATVEQMAEDIATFLHWAAYPELERRHSLGFQVLVFLILLTGLFLIVKQRVWSKLDH